MVQAISNLIFVPDEYDISSGIGFDQKRKVYTVKEFEEVDVPLSDLIVNNELQVYEPVGEGDFFSFNRKKGRLVFRAGSYIGLIPINDRVVLDVRPRVPLDNLERMLRIAEDTPLELSDFFRFYDTLEEPLPSMIDLFAQGLINAIREIEINGSYREYVQREEDTSFPHGRLRLGETMQRHAARGIKHRVDASWFEPTTDNPANRCLKYALWFLADHYTSTGQNKSRLLQGLERSFHLFSGVELDKSLQFLKSPNVANPELMPSIRSYYKPALYLALIIIRNRGVSFANRKGGILMPSFLINLQNTFETYLRNILRSKLRGISDQVRVLDGNKKGSDGGSKLLYDELPSTDAKPDIVFKSVNPLAGVSEYLLIVDAKYKNVKKPERPEIEQAVTYGASYRAPVVVIAHPRIDKSPNGLHLLGNIKPLSVYHYAFDLAAGDPEAEETKFAVEMSSLLPK